MGKSVLSFDAAKPLSGSDILYVLQGASLDRDRKVTLELLRQFCTFQGVRLLEVTLGLPGTMVEVDVSGTTNVILMAWGRFPQECDNRLNITGVLADGITATIFNGNLGLIDLRLNGNTQATTAEDLDFGPRGRAEIIGRGENLFTTVVNDSQWTKFRRDQAWEEETTRAQAAESALAGMIQGEASQRQDQDTQLGASIEAEAEFRKNADIALTARIDGADSRITTLEAVNTARGTVISGLIGTAAGIVAASNGLASVVNIDLPPGSWSVCGWVRVDNPGNGSAGSLEVYSSEVQEGSVPSALSFHAIRAQAVGTIVDTIVVPPRLVELEVAGKVQLVVFATAFYNGGSRPLSGYITAQRLQ